MKKFLALALALVMSLSLVACGGNTATDTTQNDDTTDDQTTQEVTADDIEDNMTSEDGAYEVAFVTDVGQLKDKSFNEGTWNGVVLDYGGGTDLDGIKEAVDAFKEGNIQ